jgi:protein-tyrosine-phosphatase
MKVLFVCAENVNRSQIAEAIFNRLSKRNRAQSAGLSPRIIGPLRNAYDEERGTYPPIIPMKEFGYDLSRNKIKKLNKKMAEDANKIVFMFEKKKHADEIPKYAISKRDIEFWEIPGLSPGLTFEEYRRTERARIRKIEKRVRDLVTRINRETSD